MAPTIHALLLITSLLACPYRCSGMLETPRAAEEQSTCCSHCRQAKAQPASESEPVDNQQAPAAPDDDCQCGNCLCHGAVLADDDPAGDALCSGFLLADHTSQIVLLAAGNLEPATNESPPPAAGRPLRLVLQSLQI